MDPRSSYKCYSRCALPGAESQQTDLISSEGLLASRGGAAYSHASSPSASMPAARMSAAPRPLAPLFFNTRLPVSECACYRFSAPVCLSVRTVSATRTFQAYPNQTVSRIASSFVPTRLVDASQTDPESGNRPPPFKSRPIDGD